MLAIILSACLSNDPQVCRYYRIVLNSNSDPTTCAMNAPPHFAKWAEEHPGWMIKRWRCAPSTENDI
jgi:hypothetical protein